MTSRKARQSKIESLAAIDRAIDAIDCEDLYRANIATLAHVRAACEALLAAIEAEQQFRVPRKLAHPAASGKSLSPAWTTRQFRLREISM